MSNLNCNEIGQVIYINLGEDISAATPSLILSPEVGMIKEITSGVTVGDEDVTVDNETYYADEYIKYTTKDSDLDYVGRWKKKAKLTYSSINVEQSDYIKFRVLP